MKKFKLIDPFGLKEIEAVETPDFFVLTEENIAIKRADFFEYEDELFFNRKFPVYQAVAQLVFSDYTNRGLYSPNKVNVLKYLLNGKLNLIIEDKYNTDGFFYDTLRSPIIRPFSVSLLSSSWNLSAVEKRLVGCKSISKLLVSDYSAADGLQKMTFLYKPQTSSEFSVIYNKCLQAGLAGYPVVSHIIDELDLAYYQRKEE